MPEYVPLNLSGWVVLNRMIAESDEIYIKAGGIQRLFDQDVKATVGNVSSNNLIAVDNIRDVNDQPLDIDISGWLDVAWDTSVLKHEPTRQITLRRIDGKHWMKQGPYTINLERETKWFYFGELVDGSHAWRVWPKDEWGE